MRDKPKTSRNGKKPQPPTESQFSIAHIFPDGQRLQFANHMTVQHTNEGEFTISFFEIFQPVFLGNPEEIKKQKEKLGGVIPANCIARLVVSAARMPQFIGALIKNYEIYEKDTGKSPDRNSDEQENKKHAS
jgi:hypothetical protein